jgi:hypothetical protein
MNLTEPREILEVEEVEDEVQEAQELPRNDAEAEKEVKILEMLALLSWLTWNRILRWLTRVCKGEVLFLFFTLTVVRGGPHHNSKVRLRSF